MNNTFVNAHGNNNEDLSDFIGYNNYYEQLRAEKGRGRKNNINVGPLKEFWEEDDFYVEHVKPELEMMENNNIPTRKGANIKSTAPLSRADLFKRALRNDPAEYRRVSKKYQELNDPKPAFIDFFFSEKLKKKGGRRSRKTRKARRATRNKKRRTSRK